MPAGRRIRPAPGLLPGGSGITSAGITTGTRGAPLDVDEALAGRAPAACGALVHETWPGPRLGDGTDFPEERAAVERRQASGRASPSELAKASEGGSPAAALTDAEVGQAPFGVPLPFFAVLKTWWGSARRAQGQKGCIRIRTAPNKGQWLA